jgi:N-methylhydantoinase A
LKVGPRSAGAVPGPACYGRGGTEPTVTDAALVLGMLGEGLLASGIRLDRDKAREALAPLASGLGFGVEEVARGVMTIVTANMANQIREITVEQGQDPRRARLMPFGGAGPLFGTLLARELDIGSIVVPPYAGNFSAWGLLGADLTQSAARTRITKLAPGAVEEANRVLAELFATLTARAAARDGRREVAFDMRYAGQEHTITVQVSSAHGRVAMDEDDLRELFTREYGRTFAHTMEEEVEIVSLRATLRTPLPRRGEQRITAATDGRGGVGSARAWSFARGADLDFRILQRDALGAGDRVEGPAILLEETATTYVDADFVGRVDRSGSLFVDDAEEG